MKQLIDDIPISTALDSSRFARSELAPLLMKGGGGAGEGEQEHGGGALVDGAGEVQGAFVEGGNVVGDGEAEASAARFP